MTGKARKILAQIIKQRGLKMAHLSKKIGKNHAYLHQYIRRGVPEQLPYKIAKILAETLSISLKELYESDGYLVPTAEEKIFIFRYRQLSASQKEYINGLFFNDAEIST